MDTFIVAAMMASLSSFGRTFDVVECLGATQIEQQDADLGKGRRRGRLGRGADGCESQGGTIVGVERYRNVSARAAARS